MDTQLLTTTLMRPLKMASVLLLLFGGTACKKSVDGLPFIREVSPLAGRYNTEVSIRGRYFSGSTTVQFNGMEAAITSVSDTLLKVKVPKGAGDGDITVVTGGRNIKGPVFDYQLTVTVSTVAGTGEEGFTDGPGTSATLYYPTQLAFDKDDNLYIIDQDGTAIRKLSPEGQLSTYAGNGQAGGPTDGVGSSALFSDLQDICVVPNSNTLYVADSYSRNRISKIIPENNFGKVSAIYDGPVGYADNSNLAQAMFYQITGIASDASHLYVWDQGNYCARTISLNDNSVTTLAGKPGITGFHDGQGQDAIFNTPVDITTTTDGNLLVPDLFINRIRKITTSGMVSTLAGNGSKIDADGPLPGAFNRPSQVASDKLGNIFVITGNNRNIVRMITSGGQAFTLIKNASGDQDGTAEIAQFGNLEGIAIDSKNRIYVSDNQNNHIRRIEVE